MRNNKGMTLIETVVAILVLSIAGTIIISGFYIVIHTMSEANVVKQQSNDILSFAEKAKKIMLIAVLLKILHTALQKRTLQHLMFL